MNSTGSAAPVSTGLRDALGRNLSEKVYANHG